MSVKENLNFVKGSIPDNVVLVAVSKTKPSSCIEEAYAAGQRVFGENKVQELSEKYEKLPKDIQWHFIGHLQTNKVKYIAPFISLLHGIDSYKLLEVVNKEAKKCDRVIPCLLQVHIAVEESKFGFNAQEVLEIVASEKFNQLKNVTIVGLMGMASYTVDEKQIRNEFQSLKMLFEEVKRERFCQNNDFNIISMGMSGDYEIAIEEGSTMVRVGSSIFGNRVYPK